MRTPTILTLGTLGLGGLFGLTGCSRDDLYAESTFTENVYQAYAECNASEIRFLAAKHNVQLAFDECGSNRFASFDWSPDGVNLYFQLTHGGHVLNGEEKTIAAVPTETPVAGATWVRTGLLAVPLAPADASANGLSLEVVAQQSTGSQQPFRLAWYDQTARTLTTFDLSVRQPRDLQAAGEGDRVYMTGLGEDGVRRPYVFDPTTGQTTRAFTFVDAPVEHLVVAPKADMVTWSDGHDSELMRISDGSSLLILAGVSRAIPHPDGRYVALETLGAPVSLFDQRSWNELSAEARERELTRKEKWLERLPEWAPREAQPPEIQILDLQRNERYRITAFYGEQFEWYLPRNYYCSFILWGIEGKQLHRNVALADLAERLRMLDQGDVPMGIERVTEETAEVAAQPAPSDAPASN